MNFLGLAGGPFVILRIVSTGTDKQIEKVRVTCGQTKRVPGPTVADGQSTDDDVRLGREVDAGADIGDMDERLGCRIYEAEVILDMVVVLSSYVPTTKMSRAQQALTWGIRR